MMTAVTTTIAAAIMIATTFSSVAVPSSVALVLVTTIVAAPLPTVAVVAVDEDNDEGNNTIFDATTRRVVVTDQAMGARCAVAADFDGDGLLDIVSASSNDNAVSWFRNEGIGSGGTNNAEYVGQDREGTGMPSFSIKQEINWKSLGARIVTVADIDGDGDVDVVGASYYDSSLIWYENILNENLNEKKVHFIPHLISSGINEGQGVVVADLNNDGHPDVISASSGDNTIAYFKNLGRPSTSGNNNSSGTNINTNTNNNNNVFCEIKYVVDDNAIGARTVVATDLNNDGWIDLASASKDDDTIAWYPNDGTGNFPTKIIISAGIESAGAYSLVAADIDNDGYNDLIVASNGNDHVSLWRNDGIGNQYPNFTKTLIYDSADFVLSVTVTDFDRDGDLDVASASFFDGHINWYENMDGHGYIWKNHTIDVGIQGHYVSTGDIDGDGDDDLIAVTHADNTVAIYFAHTLCDTTTTSNTSSSAAAAEECCHKGTQWNGTACAVCQHGTYGTGNGCTAKCIKCPSDVCVISGWNVLPHTCSGITGCGDIDNSLAECVCEANTMFDHTTDTCTACPDGQIRPDPEDPTIIRDRNSLGNYSLWEREQGRCSVPKVKTYEPLIIGVVVPGILCLALLGYGLYLQHNKNKLIALFTIDKNDIHYETPPVIIGRGAFGEVVKGTYRGTEVAIKRALPLEHKSNFSSGFGFSGGAAWFRNSTLKSSVKSTTTSSLVSKKNPLELDEPDTPNVSSECGDQQHTTTTTTIHRIDEEAEPGRQRRRSSIDNFGLISRGMSSKLFDLSGTFSLTNYVRRTSQQCQSRSKFIEEMSQLSKLRHPNITTTMGAVLTPREDPLLVMEYMHNGSLYDAIRNDVIDLNSREDIVTIIQDVAHGLRYLHAATPQVIHGDLKAKNILIDVNFRAKVADFGMCAKTNSGARGTPYWMSPELLTQNSPNTAMSDVYAFGILLYEIYTKKNPYAGENYHQVLKDICNPAVCKRPPVPALCPATVAALYTGCLEEDPTIRPTAQEIDTILKREGTIQGRVFRIGETNKTLRESNRRITNEQATQLAHFAAMSHEIRTPLNCIVGVSSLLEDDDDMQDSHRELVKMIVTSGKLLRDVVDDVLDFSKLVSGNGKIDVKRVNLQQTLNTLVTSMTLSPITGRKNISIQTLYDPNVPQYIETDGRRLQQILYNLLSNAVKFSKEKGTIDISVSVIEVKRRPSILATQNNGEPQSIRIVVKDYGKGIAESDFDKIFQPFQQTQTGITNVDGGTGLGLAITKQLTELLGGKISVNSKVGEWTDFAVRFPLTGDTVNTQYITSKLSTCGILLVSNSESEIQWSHEVCRYFNVNFLACRDFTSLVTCLPLERESIVACLVQEDLYDDSSYNALSKTTKTVLVTFGGGGKIARSQIHYQSLVQVFPSVLMQQLINLCDNRRPSMTQSEQLAAALKSNTSNYEQLKVMVAEDNLVNQKVLSRILQRLGISGVQLASNGQIAVDLEANESFDIIFMDIQMPVMDGIGACKRIMARYTKEEETGIVPSSPSPKIVFLSAQVSDDYLSMCSDSGAVDYMTKPCTLKDVREKLALLIKQ